MKSLAEFVNLAKWSDDIVGLTHAEVLWINRACGWYTASDAMRHVRNGTLTLYGHRIVLIPDDWKDAA